MWALACSVALGAAFRFYGLAWGAPFFHFHIDEHFVFYDAYLLGTDPRAAALSPKFFMYSPLPPYLLIALSRAYALVAHPLNLTVPHDEVIYMVLGRAISAALGTATIPLVYLIAERLTGRLAGVLAAFLLACSVIHLRDSHFFALDVSMTFFTVLAWWTLTRIVERGTPAATVGAGVALGLGLLTKYTAAFVIPLIVLAELMAPNGPRRGRPAITWARVAVHVAAATAIGVALFLLFDPLVVSYFPKFRSDIKEWVTDPLLGARKPLWVGQFGDVNPTTYWLTNLLWWGFGPALEIWALAGVVWLLIRRDRLALMAAAFPIAFWLIAGRTIAPFIRYAVPLAPPLAVAAAVLSADLLARPRWRGPAMAATTVVVATTLLWAVAYMNVYRAPDSRLLASDWLMKNVPRDARVLVEPHHNIPPTGAYLTNVNFHNDYVLWRDGHRHDYFDMRSLDVYQRLYNDGPADEQRRYIDARLADADWIVMDDTFLQEYEHQPPGTHEAMKQYYRDLFAGRLGFSLVRDFKTYPAIFGRTIDDDDAELTFRLFDHPRIFVFHRQ